MERWVPLERVSSVAAGAGGPRRAVCRSASRSPGSWPAPRAPSPWSGRPWPSSARCSPSSTCAPIRWSTTPTGSRATATPSPRCTACSTWPPSITGFVGVDGMAMMVDRLDQVAPLKAALDARRDAAPAGEKPFKGVHALQDFVPAAAGREDPHPDAAPAPDSQGPPDGPSCTTGRRSEPCLPPEDLQPFGIDELPDAIARAFTEKDGTRGRIVYISPPPTRATSTTRTTSCAGPTRYRETVAPRRERTSAARGARSSTPTCGAPILEDVPRAVLFSFARDRARRAHRFPRRRRAMARVVLAR